MVFHETMVIFLYLQLSIGLMYGASCMALFSMLYFLLFYDSVTCRVRGINVVAVDLELCMQSKSCREAASY